MPGEIIRPFLAMQDASSGSAGSPMVDVEDIIPGDKYSQRPSPVAGVNFRVLEGTNPVPSRREGTIFANTGVRIARRDGTITRLTRFQNADKARFRRIMRANPGLVGISAEAIDRDVTGVAKPFVKIGDPDEFEHSLAHRFQEFARVRTYEQIEITDGERLLAEVKTGGVIFEPGVFDVGETIEVRVTKRKKPALKRLHHRKPTS